VTQVQIIPCPLPEKAPSIPETTAFRAPWLEFGSICTPEPIRPLDRHASRQVRVDSMPRPGRTQPGLGVHCLQAREPHVSLHPLAVDRTRPGAPTPSGGDSTASSIPSPCRKTDRASPGPISSRSRSTPGGSATRPRPRRARLRPGIRARPRPSPGTTTRHAPRRPLVPSNPPGESHRLDPCSILCGLTQDVG
jgi:hypothetical protein